MSQVDLWYRIQPGFDKTELIDDMRRSGILVFNEQAGDNRSAVRLGIVTKEGWINISGKAKMFGVQDKDGKYTGKINPQGSSLSRRIVKDINAGITRIPRKEAATLWDIAHPRDKAGRFTKLARPKAPTPAEARRMQEEFEKRSGRK
jgi:hypothetical protein